MSNQNKSTAPVVQTELKDGESAGDNAETQTNEAATEQQSEHGTTSAVAHADEVPSVKAADPAPDAKAEAAKAAFDSTMVDPKIAVPMQAMEQAFQAYVDNMKRGRPVEEADGVRHQMALWTLIKSVIGRDGQEFQVMFAKLLSLMNEQRDGGVMDPRLVYRFFGALPLGQVDGGNFQSILQALLTLSDPQNRKIALKQVDLGKVFVKYPDKAAAQRVLEFFGY